MTAEQYLYARKFMCKLHRRTNTQKNIRYISGCENCPLFCESFVFNGISCLDTEIGYSVYGMPEVMIVGIVEQWWREFIGTPQNLAYRRRDKVFLELFPEYASEPEKEENMVTGKEEDNGEK